MYTLLICNPHLISTIFSNMDKSGAFLMKLGFLTQNLPKDHLTNNVSLAQCCGLRVVRICELDHLLINVSLAQYCGLGVERIFEIFRSLTK